VVIALTPILSPHQFAKLALSRPAAYNQNNKKWSDVTINSLQQRSDSSSVLRDKGDSHQITALIEQLDRDLEQTLKKAHKSTAKPR